MEQNNLGNSNDPQVLIRLIGEQLSESKIMLDILVQEYEVLRSNDLALFESNLQKKQIQAKKLEELEPNIALMKSIIQGPVTHQSVDTYINRLPDKAMKMHLGLLWNQLHSTLHRCKEQNRINNRVIEASRSSLEQAIDILHGGNSAPNLYRASGKRDGGKQCQSLAIA